MIEETVYSLATIYSTKTNGIRGLTVDEFESISKEISDLEKFYNEEALYDLIDLNYQDLIKRRDFYIHQCIANPRLSFSDISSQFIDLNRLILNFLSSVRTYLDHTETRLKRNFGANSVEVELFKKLLSDNYDSYFAYRFLSKLRNYSQHCGLPAGSISITNDIMGHNLKLSLVRDDLLNEYDSWSEKVKPDLQKQDKIFDILPLLEKKAELLNEVNNKISSTLLKKLTNQGNHLLELIRETQIKGKGIPCLLKICGDTNNCYIEMKWFPCEIISKITGVDINIANNEE